MKATPALTWNEHIICTPIGELVIWLDQKSILQFIGWQEFRQETMKQLCRFYQVPTITLQKTAQSPTVIDTIKEYFVGNIRAIDTLVVAACGTEFQKKVWQALRAIPAGSTTSYGELAKQIGSPQACRAVGMANNRNPIAIVVPCHRVIGKNNQLTGYAGGLNRKQWLLDHERQYSTLSL